MDEIVPKPVDQIEGDFDRFFKSIGFHRVEELTGRAPAFSNADYYSHNGPIVVELKVITKDYFEHGGFVNRLHAIVPVPVNVDSDGYGVYKVSVPHLEAGGKMDSLEPQLRRLLRKADVQISETVKHVLEGKGIGFVFIALHGFVSAHPSVVYNLLRELFQGGDYPNIAGFIVCSLQWSWKEEETEDRVHSCYGSVEDSLPTAWANAWNGIGLKYCEWAQNGGHLETA